MTIKAHLWAFLDQLGPAKISGWALFDEMHARTGRMTYPPTLLDYAREYADISGGEFRCVDPARSVYKFSPGAKIAGAIVDRR